MSIINLTSTTTTNSSKSYMWLATMFCHVYQAFLQLQHQHIYSLTCSSLWIESWRKTMWEVIIQATNFASISQDFTCNGEVFCLYHPRLQCNEESLVRYLWLVYDILSHPFSLIYLTFSSPLKWWKWRIIIWWIIIIRRRGILCIELRWGNTEEREGYPFRSHSPPPNL